MKKILFTIVLTLISVTAFTTDYWSFSLINGNPTVYTNYKTGKNRYDKCEPFKSQGFPDPGSNVNFSVFRGGIKIDIGPDLGTRQITSFLIFPSKDECEKIYKLYYPQN